MRADFADEMALIQKNPIHLLSQIRKKFPEAEKEDWILRLDDKKKHKRGSVVCVARRASNSEGLPDDSKLSLISFTLDPSHRIINALFRDSQFDISPSEVIGRCVDELCCKDDKSVLDTLLDSVAECSAELHLRIKDRIITTRAHTVRTANAEEPVILECTVTRLKSSPSSESLDRCVHKVSDCSTGTLHSNDLCSVPEVPSCSEPSSNCPEAPPPVNFETLSPPSDSVPEAENESGSDALSQLCTTIFSESDAIGETYPVQSAPAMVSQPPHLQFYSDQMYYMQCSSSLPPPNMYSSQFVPNEAPVVELNKNGKVKRPRKPRQPKTAVPGRQRGANQRRKSVAAKEQAISNITPPNIGPWDPQSSVASPNVQCTNGPPKVKDALLKSLLQSQHPSEQSHQTVRSSSAGAAGCSTMSETVPLLRSSSETHPSYSYQDQFCPLGVNDQTNSDLSLCIPSTSSSRVVVTGQQQMMYQAAIQTQPVANAGFMPNGIASTAAPQMNNGYATQMSLSACCSYTDSPAGPSSTDCTASYDGVHGMVPSNSQMVSMNPMGSESLTTSVMQLPQGAVAQPQMVQNVPQWAGPSPDFMYQSTVYQQQTSNMQPMKASPLKRKTGTPQGGQHELPQKLPHMNSPYASYQRSPQYQQSVASPQFPSQPQTPNNRLSPYNSYENGQNGLTTVNSMGQWGKRPPSRSELIRMELRHSVQARQHAASPNNPAALSPHDLGAPRFPGVPYSQMMSPRMAPPSPSMNALNGTPGGSSPQMMGMPSSNQQQQPKQQQQPYYTSQDIVLCPDYSLPMNQQAPSNYMQQTPIIPNELYDFNLGNGPFDMDSDATRSLVQKLLS